MAYLYRHIRKDTNQVFYIGIGTRENHRRARTIVRRNRYWKNIVSKTEWESEVVFDDISIDEAKKKEVEFIALYGRSDLGLGTLVNMTDGGDGTFGIIISDEKRKEMSIRNMGKTLSAEHKNKISEAHKGKVFSDNTLQKMRDAKIGTKQSEDTINKRRLKLMGNKSNTGKKWTDSQREKVRLYWEGQKHI